MGQLILPTGGPVNVDANAIIYSVERVEPYHGLLAPMCEEARAGLLDVVDAMRPLCEAAVLVGAQAVYGLTRRYDVDFAVAPLKFDADVALSPELLVNDPRIPDLIEAAGYNLTGQPGIYKRDDGTQVDLLVPEGLGGRRGRGDRLGVHGNRTARQVRGLEGTLVSDRMYLGWLV